MSLTYRIGSPLSMLFSLDGVMDTSTSNILLFSFFLSRISVPPCLRIESKKVLYLLWLGQSLVYTVHSGLCCHDLIRGQPEISRLARETGSRTP
jgi:hypothetical protein